MSTFSWFRRFHTRDFTGARARSLESRPHPQLMLCLMKRECLFDNSSLSGPQKRLYHLSPVSHQFKSTGMTNNQRYSYLYATHTHNNVTEDFRSKVKFLTSKNNPSSDGYKPAKPVLPKGTDPKEEDDASVASSVVTCPSVSETFSVTATRNETAREFNKPMVFKISEPEDKSKRIACPKPLALSPYAKSSDDGADKGDTLKSHYTKVLLQPSKSFGVTFPPVHKITVNRNKPRRYDQYLGTAKSTVMPAKPFGSNITQNRHMQSNSGESNVTVSSPPDGSLDQVANNNDNRYLEICSASDDKIFESNLMSKKHVEVVKMEVIKLNKKLRKTLQQTDIKRELEHVLQEALAQSKVYEQNVLHAHKCDEMEQEQNQAQRRRRNFLTYGNSEFGPPRSSHSTVVLDKEKKASQGKVSYDQTRARVRSHSEDGRHCYSILKAEPADNDNVTLQASQVKEAEGKDVSMALTDLKDYEDLSDKTSSKVLNQMVTTATSKSSSEIEKSDDISLSKDAKIARRQHQQRVLDVFDIVKGVKVK